MDSRAVPIGSRVRTSGDEGPTASADGAGRPSAVSRRPEKPTTSAGAAEPPHCDQLRHRTPREFPIAVGSCSSRRSRDADGAARISGPHLDVSERSDRPGFDRSHPDSGRKSKSRSDIAVGPRNDTTGSGGDGFRTVRSESLSRVYAVAIGESGGRIDPAIRSVRVPVSTWSRERALEESGPFGCGANPPGDEGRGIRAGTRPAERPNTDRHRRRFRSPNRNSPRTERAEAVRDGALRPIRPRSRSNIAGRDTDSAPLERRPLQLPRPAIGCRTSVPRSVGVRRTGRRGERPRHPELSRIRQPSAGRSFARENGGTSSASASSEGSDSSARTVERRVSGAGRSRDDGSRRPYSRPFCHLADSERFRRSRRSDARTSVETDERRCARSLRDPVFAPDGVGVGSAAVSRLE